MYYLQFKIVHKCKNYSSGKLWEIFVRSLISFYILGVGISLCNQKKIIEKTLLCMINAEEYLSRKI